MKYIGGKGEENERKGVVITVYDIERDGGLEIIQDDVSPDGIRIKKKYEERIHRHEKQFVCKIKNLIAISAFIGVAFGAGLYTANQYLTSNASNQILQSVENKDRIEKYEKENDSVSPFNKDGQIFPDSNRRYLSEEEILLLKDREDYSFSELLRYSVNEIYARAGFSFGSSEWNNYYDQFEWYRTTEKKDVRYETMNKYEQYNLDLLVRIEEEYGYR